MASIPYRVDWKGRPKSGLLKSKRGFRKKGGRVEEEEMRGEYISSPFFAEGEKASGNSNSARRRRKEIPKRAIP